MFGAVASDPTISRVFTTLAGDVDAALTAIRQARADARARAWTRRRPLAGVSGARSGGQVIVDIDATLVTAHSDKEGAEPTFKRGFGFAPMCSFVDHGEHGTGEPLALDLRPGKASPWNSADHLAVLNNALAQLPEHERRQVLVRADTGACSKMFLSHITDLGLEYSIGFQAQDTVKAAIEAIPEQAWRAAVDGDGEPRDGAQVAELTAWMPTPVTQHRASPQRMADHLLRHQHQGPRLDPRGTRGPAPATRPLRGPDPWPEGHRAAEPALPRLRQEPALARGRRPRHRPTRLDTGTRVRPARARPSVGTQTAPIPAPRRRRPHHPNRPPKTPPTTPRLALEPPHRQRLALAPNRLTA